MRGSQHRWVCHRFYLLRQCSISLCSSWCRWCPWCHRQGWTCKPGYGNGYVEKFWKVPMARSHGFFCTLAVSGFWRTTRLPVLRRGSGVDAANRRLAYSYLEESGWSFPFGVPLLLDDLESPADLGASDFLCLGGGFKGRSSIQVYIDDFGVPVAAKDGFKKVDVASSEASSSSWTSVSSCKFVVSFFQGGSVGWRFRSPASRITRRVLQGHGCNSYLVRDVLVNYQCNMLYQ